MYFYEIDSKQDASFPGIAFFKISIDEFTVDEIDKVDEFAS